jgi:RNA polymerase sigma factor (sigma-70 family)
MASTPATQPQELFEQLYTRYVQDVYRYSLALLRNPADAEDVTQTTFMNAYRALKRGEVPEQPHHWLIVIAHNACRTRASRAARRPREVPLDETVQEVPVPESERPNLRAVLEALGRLPFNQRSALVMRELEGRTYEEIAETLGVTVAAVETLIFRARRSLRLRRDAFRTLALVQAPASLASFGGSVASGGGLLLGGAALKAAALVAAIVAGGGAYELVAHAPSSRLHARPTASQVLLAAGVTNEAATTGRVRAAARIQRRTAVATHRRAHAGAAASPGGTQTAQPGRSDPTSASQPTATGTSGTGTQGPSPSTTTATTAPAVTVAVPSAPALPVPVPTVPATTVSTPSVPVTVPLPTTTVAVTIPSVTIATPPLP